MNNNPTNDEYSALLNHLVELRQRLIRSVIVVLIVFAGLYVFANDIYHLLATPLLHQLPQGSQLIATGIAAPFLAPLKLTFAVTIVFSLPFLLHQVWGFISPGLYLKEKRWALPLLCASVILFYLGMCFAYFVVLPLVFGFFTHVAPQGVLVTPDINNYLDFTLKLLFAFGLTFETPIVTMLLIRSGIVSSASLCAKRPYIIVAAFVIGMLLTPPDILSQTLLAIPLWLLFELGIILARWSSKRN